MENTLLTPVQIVNAEKDSGVVHSKWKIDEGQVTMGGYLHGGCTAAMVDQITGLTFLVMSGGSTSVSVELNVSYLTLARAGETLDVYAKLIKSGKSLAFLEADIRNEAGKQVASGKHTVAVIDNVSVRQFVEQIYNDADGDA